MNTNDKIQIQIQIENENKLQEQTQANMEQDLEAGFREEYNFNQYLIEERATEVEKIRHDSQILNEIMMDLAEMVNNQGEGINTIKNETNKTKKRTENALNELRKTKKYQEEPCCSFCYIC